MDEWSKLYGEVVWAKWDKSWYPSYVFDPELIIPSEKDREVREKGLSLINKQYVVLFYSDNTFGFMPPKSVKTFYCPDKDKLMKQNVGKRYMTDFLRAVEVAEKE